MKEKIVKLIEYYKQRAKMADDIFTKALKKNNQMQANMMFGYKKCFDEVVSDLEKIVQDSQSEKN